MFYILLKRLLVILLTIGMIMVAGFAILRWVPGDQVALQQSGYSAQRHNVEDATAKYNAAYYSGGYQLPVFYFSVSTLAVPDSFYYLPGNDFQFAAVRLSLLSGQPELVYRTLKLDPALSW